MGFEVVAPCKIALGDGSLVEATALVKVGPPNGMVVDPDWRVIEPSAEKLFAEGFGYSAVEISGNDEDLVDVIRDWSGD